MAGKLTDELFDVVAAEAGFFEMGAAHLEFGVDVVMADRMELFLVIDKELNVGNELLSTNLKWDLVVNNKY